MILLTLSRMHTFGISSVSRNAAILARAIFQGHLRGPNAPIQAKKGQDFVEISVNQGVAPAAPSRMLTFEINFADSHERAQNIEL